MQKYLIFLIILLLSGFLMVHSYGSDFDGISPVTRNVIMLRFVDGYVDHHSLGQTKENDITHNSPLDPLKAGLTSTYYVVSNSDPHYLTPREVAGVGRKSFGSDFSGKSSEGFPIVQTHHIYLQLPYPLIEGEEYRITFTGLASNTDSIEFLFNPKNLFSESIHVNQTGYSAKAPVKLAYLSQWMGDLGPVDLDYFSGKNFYLLSSDEQLVYSGQVMKRKDLETGGPDGNGEKQTPWGSFTGSDVFTCDFSEFKTPGTYRLVVEDLGCSFPFTISMDGYRQAFRTVTRAMYHQRCGTELSEIYTPWSREICHHPAHTDTVILSEWRYMDKRNAFTELPQYATSEKRPVWGGWHDAADWDRRTEHLEGTRYLLLAYDLRPDNFSDGELNIPESGNGIPDILDEALWNIDFFMRLQDNDGGIRGGVETTGHPAAGVGSVQDRDQWYAYGKDPFVSFSYAGTAGQMAICLQKAGADSLADHYIESAMKAYNWALNNQSPEEKEMMEMRDERHYAASVLYRITGEEKFQQQFVEDNQVLAGNTRLFVWQKHDQTWGAWMYLLTFHDKKNRELSAVINEAIINWANVKIITPAGKRGYRFGSDFDAATGWGNATMPEVFELAMAWIASGDPSYLSWAYTNCDYVLGANPLNMCWITGMGSRNPQQLMHLDSRYYHKDKGLVPGLIPFGPAVYVQGAPDGHWQEGHAYKALYPEGTLWPSHEMYFENQYCAKTNEFTVHKPVLPAAAAFGLLSSPMLNDLSHEVINGESQIHFYQQNLSYFVEEVEGANYHWIVPESAEILEGQDSSYIRLNWGCSTEALKLRIEYSGKTYEIQKPLLFEKYEINGPERIIEESEEISYSVNAPDSFDIQWSGSGNIELSNPVNTSNLNLHVWGEGRLFVEINNSCGSHVDSMDILFGENQVTYPQINSPHPIPGSIKTAWFDDGGEGVSYHDSDPLNNGNGIRPGEGVDTEEKDGSQTIGWVVSGEWLEYTVNIAESSFYELSVRVAGPNDQGKFLLSLDDIQIVDTLFSVNTGSWADFTTIKTDSIFLEQKSAVLKLSIIEGGFNVGDLEFTKMHFIPDHMEENRLNGKRFLIYPNPVSSGLKIRDINSFPGELNCIIRDLAGKVILEDRINDNELNISFLDQGIYIITLEKSLYRETQMLIKR